MKSEPEDESCGVGAELAADGGLAAEAALGAAAAADGGVDPEEAVEAVAVEDEPVCPKLCLCNRPELEPAPALVVPVPGTTTSGTEAVPMTRTCADGKRPTWNAFLPFHQSTPFASGAAAMSVIETMSPTCSGSWSKSCASNARVTYAAARPGVLIISSCSSVAACNWRPLLSI